MATPGSGKDNRTRLLDGQVSFVQPLKKEMQLK
jgi:hypothetical protein